MESNRDESRTTLGKRARQMSIRGRVEVIAHSRSERKLERLKKRLASPFQLQTISGAVDLKQLLTLAQVIFYDAYLTYDDRPEKVQHHLEVLRSQAYIGSDSNMLRIFSPELYGAEASDTFVYYAFQRMVHCKTIKQLFDPAIRQEYAFFEDALRDTLELAISSAAYGRTWKLHTNGPISQTELLTAAYPDAALPRFKRVARWKIGLLFLAEPKIRQLMKKYSSNNRGAITSAINYVGGHLTSYEVGATITMERLKSKREDTREASRT